MKIDNQFDSQGYIVVKKLFSQNEIEKITLIADKYNRQWQQQNYSVLLKDRSIDMHSLTEPIYFINNDSKRIEFF